MIHSKLNCVAIAAHCSMVVVLVFASLVGPRVHGAAAGEAGEAEEASSSPAETRRLGDLFYQLQLLQQEVRDLRGLVEQQSYQIKRMAKSQREQYIDLDRRVAGLRSAPTYAAGNSALASTAGSAPCLERAGSSVEVDAYNYAFQLTQKQQFDASIMAFNKLIVDYPNGRCIPNAFYWLGELYLKKTQHEKARQSFVQVVNLYPAHAKVPDALYKLGVVYSLLGDAQRSTEYLSRVRREHPRSSAAGLAQTFATELR